MNDPQSSVQNYRTCREVLQGLSWDAYGEEWGPPMRHLFFSLINASDPRNCSSQAGYHRSKSDGTFEKAMMLRNIFAPISDRYYEKTVFLDVYQLATYISLSNGGQWTYSTVIPRYFRGQTRKWPLVPSILRHCQNATELSVAIERLTRFVRAFQKARPGTSDEQAIAIAQHYSSKENGLWTWLIDVTWDPLVGLFFASYGGEAGETGVLWHIEEKEWVRLSGGGGNRMGALRAIEAPGIHRIHVQKGLFIEAPHPQLFEDYAPYSMEFEQVEGLTFEDGMVELPITREFLLKEDENLNAIIKNSVDCPAEPKISSARQPRAIARMTANDYFEIVSSWVQNKPEWKLSDDCRTVLVALCELHAKIHEMGVLASDAQILSDLHYLGSLHHLWRGVRAIFDPIGINVLEHNYVSATGNEWLRGQLQEHASEVLKKDRNN